MYYAVWICGGESASLRRTVDGECMSMFYMGIGYCDYRILPSSTLEAFVKVKRDFICASSSSTFFQES